MRSQATAVRAVLAAGVFLGFTSGSATGPFSVGVDAEGRAGVADSLRAGPPPGAGDVYGRLPLHFEANLGQADPSADFVARGQGYALALSATRASFALGTPAAATSATALADSGRDEVQPAPAGVMLLSMHIEGANPSARADGEAKLPGVAHYYRGDDASRWQTDVALFERVRYSAVLEGIDLVYYGNQRRLEYDFIVAPGADWQAIALRFEGASRIEIEQETGDLLVHVGDQVMRQHAPFTYQVSDTDGREEIASRYTLAADGLVRFDLGAYDRSRPLVIDPVLVYSTYLGGTSDDTAYGVAVDASSRAHIVGVTRSATFPLADTPVGHKGAGDVFVLKLNALGDAVEYVTFLGGSGTDIGYGIGLDHLGHAYVGGQAGPGFPVTAGALQGTHGDGGGADGFVAKLTPAGTLAWATYLGGNANSEYVRGVAVGKDGSVYAVGRTRSTNFPVSGMAFIPTYQQFIPGSFVAFVTRISSSGALMYSTYLGYTSTSQANAVAVDDEGHAYVTGYTQAHSDGGSLVFDFPVVTPIGNPLAAGAFVTKLAPNGLSLVYSAILGGPTGTGHSGEAIAVDQAGSAYVGGFAREGFETKNAFRDQPDPSGDGFVAKVNVLGTNLDYATFIGGSAAGSTEFGTGYDIIRAIAVDQRGNVFAAGETRSPNFAQIDGLPVPETGGESDGFVVKLDEAGCNLLFSTYLGGSQADTAFGIALDPQAHVYVVGDTQGAEFPTANALSSTHQGGIHPSFGGRLSDAFISKLTPGNSVQPPCALQGRTAENPLLPVIQNGVFRFFGRLAPNWFDPPMVDAFDFVMTDGSLFSAILDFPSGIDADDRFTVSVDGVVLGTFGPGQPVVFANFAPQLGAALVNGQGVVRFRVSDIGPPVDAANPLAFPIKLDFSRSPASFDMIPIVAPALPVPGTLQFAQGTYAVSRDSGHAMVTVVRTGGADGTVTIGYATSAGTAVAGVHYTATSGTLSFAPGQTSAAFMVPILDGGLDVPDAAAALTLSAPGGGAALGSLSSAVLSIAGTQGAFTSYFAEGATGSFFDTTFSVLNPTAGPATVTMSHQRAGAPVISHDFVLGPGGHHTVRAGDIPGLGSAEFATTVLSTAPVVVDRTMRWGAERYGSHAQEGIGAPALEWYFAEGATGSQFALFYLLQNPNDVPATVEVTYLRADGAPIVKTYDVAPQTRRTLWVNHEDPALSHAEVSGVVRVVNGVAIVAERAMYLTRGDVPFLAGHVSAGVAAPATRWILAEGATGPYFDFFVLVANPHPTDVDVDVTYLLPNGGVVQRTHRVPASRRYTIWVDQEDPLLADTAASVIAESPDGLPVIVERAMWWPGSSATWHEGHAGAGVLQPGTRWAVAGGVVGGVSQAETYYLVANTSAHAGSVRVTLRFEDGSSEEQTLPVGPSSRVNVPVGHMFPASAGRRFGAVIESVGASPVEIVVEQSVYEASGTMPWAAGTSAQGTKLP